MAQAANVVIGPDAGTRRGTGRCAVVDANRYSAPGGVTATLHVNPQQWVEARSIVAAVASPESAGPIAGLNVVADEHRALDALLLETRLGFVESNLELTLAEARNLVRLAVDRAARFTACVA